MAQYFDVNIEFDHSKFLKGIDDTISRQKKGYVCVVDANVLTIAQKDKHYRDILNESLVNTCDGSSIAWLAGITHNRVFRALNGPEIFQYYIEKRQRHLLLGSTEVTVEKIKETLRRKGLDDSNISYISLPFLSVNDFDYKDIGGRVNELHPDIIWVSLGAPKQEVFMSRVLPYLEQGIMFGIGAAFNFYIGNLTLPKFKMGALRFIWMSRIISEPKKQIKRVIPYLIMLPRLYFKEKRKLKEGAHFIS